MNNRAPGLQASALFLQPDNARFQLTNSLHIAELLMFSFVCQPALGQVVSSFSAPRGGPAPRFAAAADADEAATGDCAASKRWRSGERRRCCARLAVTRSASSVSAAGGSSESLRVVSAALLHGVLLLGIAPACWKTARQPASLSSPLAIAIVFFKPQVEGVMGIL